MCRTARGYLLNGHEYNSATTIINGVLFKKFEAEKKAAECNANPRSPYYQLTVPVITKMWNDKAAFGTRLHSYIESRLMQTELTVEVDDMQVEVQQAEDFIHYLHSAGYRLITCELFMHCDKSMIAGTCDGILVDSDNRYCLFDWKTSIIDHRCYGFGIHPTTQDIGDSKYNKYSVQLNIYAELLRRQFGVTVEDRMYLVSFNSSLDNYEIHQVHPIEQIEDIFNIQFE